MRTELFGFTLYSLKDMGTSENLTFRANHRGCGTCLLMRSRSSPGRDCPTLFTYFTGARERRVPYDQTRLPTKAPVALRLPLHVHAGLPGPAMPFFKSPRLRLEAPQIRSCAPPLLPLYPHPRHLPPPTFPLFAFHRHHQHKKAKSFLTEDDRADSYPSSRR